jgi:tripartite-type tricarboxylate transporter receptor subunit TctC
VIRIGIDPPSSLPGLTRQSIVLKNEALFSMDARVKPAHDRSRTTVAGIHAPLGEVLMKIAHVGAAALAAVLALSTPAPAQEHYPSRLITVVVPITAGTTIDILARLYGEALSRRFGQQVVIANRPGAGGLIGAQAVAGAPPDGYTVLLANSGHAILGTLNKNLPFDPVGDFAGVCLIGDAPTVVNVAPSLGVRTLREFVDLAKAKPGSINYGSAGIGTATHLAGAYFALQTGTQLVHVPYTVSSTIIADLLGGRIGATFAPAAFTLPLLQDGKLLALAVAADEPIREPIAVPTALSANVDYRIATWYGFLAPAKTPSAVLQALHDAIVEVGKDPELQAKIRIQGITPQSIGLRDFDTHIRKDMARLEPLLATIARSN